MENQEWITGKIAIAIRGVPIEMEMTVPAKPVKPHRMLPVFQKMTNSFVDVSVQAMNEIGETISCKAGCGACCHQPVPIAEVEVYQIAELVENMPEPRRSEIKKRFAEAVDHFESIGWFERIRKAGNLKMPDNPQFIPTELLDAAIEYFNEGIPCPFLENNSCSIHENRPLSCREYLVTSPAESCSRPTGETVKKVPLLIRPSRSLPHLGATGSLSGIGVLPLIRALEVAEKIPEHFQEKTGDKWMADFFAHLMKTEIPQASEKPVEKTRRKPRQKR
ncbi:MAG TPA: YkgJ family cysteine cluster protein [Pyrinomonadaceae bacterium]|nr:YkgJ family cysteine cluster protein [Pyrinomonadaceae bacterium]